MADDTLSQAPDPLQRMQDAITRKNAAQFESSLRDMTAGQLNELQAKIEEGVKSAPELKQAAERVRESLAIDRSLEGLEARLKKVELLARVLAAPAAPGTTAEQAQSTPVASKEQSAVPAESTPELQDFDRKLTTFAQGFTFVSPRLLSVLRYIPGLGVSKEDDSATAVKKALLTVLATPSLLGGLVGMDATTPILGALIGQWSAKAKLLKEQLQARPEQEAKQKVTEQQREQEEQLVTNVKKSLGITDGTVTLNESAGVSAKRKGSTIDVQLPRSELGADSSLTGTRARTLQLALQAMPESVTEITISQEGAFALTKKASALHAEIPAGDSADNIVAIAKIAEKVRMMGRVQSVRLAGPEVPRGKHTIEFRTDGTLLLAPKDGETLTQFAATVESWPLEAIADAPTTTRFALNNGTWSALGSPVSLS
jgi:hypothetical protein